MADVRTTKRLWFQRVNAIAWEHPAYSAIFGVILTVGLFVPQLFMNWRTYRNFYHISQQELRLQKLSDRITYFDEVLTMSARMNAATGDRSWEKRYREFEPLLDAAIKESINLIPEVYSSQDAEQIDIANQKLVAMESRSFELVQQNQPSAALRLLSSLEYENQKQIYAQGVEKRNQQIQEILNSRTARYYQDLQISYILIAITILLLVPLWLFVLHVLQTFLKARNFAYKELEKANDELSISIQKLQTAQELIQKEKISSLTQMVAGIAHEINNPISFIRGNLQHIKNYTEELIDLIKLYQQEVNISSQVREKAEEIDFEFMSVDIDKALQSMHGGTERIKQIVLELRAFSCLDEAECKTIDIHAGLESTIALIQHRLKLLNIELIREYQKLPLVECYPSQLNQAFMSLITNAIEAIETSKHSSGKIIIRSELHGEDWIRISIIDSGDGIQTDIATKIFDPFFTTKPIGKSKGLGLSISHQIITRSHHGKIYFQPSQYLSGTKFILEIPLKLPSPMTLSQVEGQETAINLAI